MKTTHIPALFGFVMLALVVGLELNQPPPALLNPDPHALNFVDDERVQFHGLPFIAERAAIRAAFGAPDRVYTYINDFTGNSEVWVYGRSEVSFHDDDGDRGTFDIQDARYPVKIGTLTLRVGESAAPLATAFPISWRNLGPMETEYGPSVNDWFHLSLSDDDVEILVIAIDGDGKIVRIASTVIRV